MSDSPPGRQEKERRMEEEIMDGGKKRPRAKVSREKDFKGFFGADMVAGLTLLIHH